MADLDSFFARKDRKKVKGRKFTTTDEIARRLEETEKKLEQQQQQGVKAKVEALVKKQPVEESAAEEQPVVEENPQKVNISFLTFHSVSCHACSWKKKVSQDLSRSLVYHVVCIGKCFLCTETVWWINIAIRYLLMS